MTMAVAAARPVRARHRVAPYALIVPAAVMLAIAMGYPVGWLVWASFMHFTLATQFGAPPEFAGFANYVRVFTDPAVWSVIGRSLAFCLVNAVVTMLIGIGVALLMKAVNTGVRLVLQVTMLLAWAMPVVASVTVWSWLFDWRRGVVNYLLTSAGLDMTNYQWLGTRLGLYFVATVIIVWMSVPFVAFSVYAGLTQVSEDVMEAAQIDGASAARRFTAIVLPLVRPVLMIVGLLQIIWDLRVFTQIKMLQDQSRPLDSDLLGTYIFNNGFGNFSLGATLSIVVLLVTIVFSAVYVVQIIKDEPS